MTQLQWATYKRLAGGGGATPDDSEGDGISQDDADARYLRLSGGDLTGNLDVDAGSGTAIEAGGTAAGASGTPAILVVVGTTTDGIGMAIKRGTEANDMIRLNVRSGGSGKPGIEFGAGAGSQPDTSIYREGASHLRTEDTFQVNELLVDSAGIESTKQNLDLGSAADLNIEISDTEPALAI